MIAYNFDFSENSQVVSNYKVDYSIIQMDRGTANTSNMVKNIIERYPNFVLSMSEAGFKHNAPTEALNGWFKECFFAEYGNIFLIIQEFLNKFDEFIIKRNSLQTYIYNKKRSQII
ncbi:hypothetical protein [Spiroplasma turonicum]|uniref:Transposase n=1 Tax=Spiroplasma turonicum TaxID=216946 RepID=A0A0K1P6F2_9MOLU|nr:hypothetical protein [Spiroplasma turonicum]AKU79896.1 hypothetical protein STURON_00650 [Spiroplasma turonicum]